MYMSTGLIFTLPLSKGPPSEELIIIQDIIMNFHCSAYLNQLVSSSISLCIIYANTLSWCRHVGLSLSHEKIITIESK